MLEEASWIAGIAAAIFGAIGVFWAARHFTNRNSIKQNAKVSGQDNSINQNTEIKNKSNE